MKNFKNVLVLALFFVGAVLMAQTKLSGKVVDENNMPLPGADVVIKGTTKGTITDFDGNFTLECKNSLGTVEFSFMGFETKSIAYNGNKNFGNVMLAPSANSLDEIVIVGVADIARDRKTPVASTTIKAAEIVERLGSQELPELLNATPSVYATKQGGGFGDSRINVRGFDQRNTAVLINGVPVNDMENGWVYWSNWAGLSDVTSAMQIQRGLGSSKLAISSVGGTINILTKTSDAKEGGNASFSYGNDNYMKGLVSYNTGKLDSGLSASVLLSQTQGDGYVYGTKFKGNTYFIGLGYEINDKNSIMFTATGAPQWHHQRSYANPISNYIKYGKAGEPDVKYNSDWGYLNGEEFSWRRNFYHKPVASLNWDMKFNESSNLSTVLYASWGRGGGTGPIGRINGQAEYKPQFITPEGTVRFDDIVAWNSGTDVPDFGAPRANDGVDGSGNPIYINDRGDGFTRRASMVSHNWYGIISNFNTELNDNLKLDLGIDLRTYKGIHYRIVNDDLGASGYFDNRDKNFQPDGRDITEYYEANPSWNPFVNIKDQQKIEYYNDGNVRWEGLFGQLEYNKDNVSAFVQAGASYQQFQRVDYFNYLDSDDAQTTDWINIFGGNVKGGINMNLSDRHNLFLNAGYYSKQPGFDAIFLNYVNNINEDYQNEKILGFELGYGYRAERATFNLNLYHTTWTDRYTTTSETIGGTRYFANILGVKEKHMGVETEVTYRALDNLKLTGMLSIGNWEYAGNADGTYFDENNNPVGSSILYLDGVKVGDAAQFTSRLGMEWKVFKNFTFDASQFYADNLYANINATSFSTEVNDGSLELPAYSLTDAGVSYKFELNDGMNLKFRFNLNNVWDHVYISESDSNRHATSSSTTWQGIDVRNNVYFGYGRTWNASVRFSF